MIRIGMMAVAFGAAVGSLVAQDVVLTRPAARHAHPFSSVTGLRELSDGRLLVADGIDGVLVRVELGTGRMDTVGRAGQGPGEYRSPDGLYGLPEDATLLVDLGNGRLSSFDRAGKYLESFPIAQGQPRAGPGPVPLIFPRATDAAGRIYFQPVGGGAQADSGAIVRWDRGAGRFDTVARVKLPPTITRTSGGPNNRNVRQRQPPYPAAETWAVAPDGRVAIVRAPTYRIEWVALGGERTVGPANTAAPVPVRDAEKREYLTEAASNGLSVSIDNQNGRISMQFSRGRSDRDTEDDDIASLEWPKVKPIATGGNLVGPDGRLWVERSVPAGAERSYDVFDGAGVLVRRVTLPVGRRLVLVGTRGLYARQVDADGINYLERYDR